MQMALRRSSSVVVAALVIGAIAAVTEMVPVFPIQAALGVSPRLVLQSIASGVLGRQAYSGGAATVLLGVAFHLLISVVAALLYLVASERWPGLRRHPLLAGIAYGTVVFLVMRYVVVPLSAVAYSQSTEWRMFAISLAVHILGFGIPIALMDRWWAGAGARRDTELAPSATAVS
jgi:uncharacterized membrane protein YagU involved in acid resistance